MGSSGRWRAAALVAVFALLAAISVESRVELAAQGDALRRDHATVQAMERQLETSTAQVTAARADAQLSQGQFRMVLAAIAQQEHVTPAALQVRLQLYCAAVGC